MSAEHAIKVFGNTDNQVAGLNGAIKMNPVTSGGKKNKSNKQDSKVHRGGKKNKSNKQDSKVHRGGKKNKSKKNKSYKNKTMRGGK